MYFVTTILDEGMIKIRPLPHQKIPMSPTDPTLTDVDTKMNVGCAKELRKIVPVGTVFCTKEMYCGYGFYITTPSVASEGIIYPVSLTLSECKKYGTTDEMIRAYQGYCVSKGDAGEIVEKAGTKVVTYLDTLMAHRGYKPPTIEKNQYYVDFDTWYFLIRCLDKQTPLMVTGSTGCHGINTPIRMADLTVKMVQDVRVGDLLLGDDGTPRKVLSLARGREQMYKINQVKGMDYVVNESHILSLKRYRRQSKRINGKRTSQGSCFYVENISVKDYLTSSKYTDKGYKAPLMEFSEQDVEIDPYFLGLWLGDGTSSKMDITNGDYEIVKWLRDYQKSTGYGLIETLEANCVKFSFSGNNGELVKKFRAYDLICEYKDLRLNINQKHIPNEYLTNSVDVRRKLLAGILDTDGSLSNNCYDIIQKSREFAYDIRTLCKSLGLTCEVTEKVCTATNGTEGNSGTYYRSCISGEGLELLPLLVERKKAAKRKQIKNALHTGINIEKLGIGDYYGFELDGNHLYCLEDFTVTHNSGKTSMLTYAAKALRKKIYYFDMGSMTDPVTTLLGAHRIKMVDGNQVSVFDRSEFSKRIEEDCIIVLDELSRAPSTALNFLFPLLDHRRELPMQYADSDSVRTVKAHPNCLFIATANVGGEYGGTASLDRALVDRFMLLDIDYMPTEREVELLCSLYGISYDESAKIMSIVASLRDMFKKGDLSTSVSIRYTKMIASMVADGYTILQSLKLVINPLFEGTDSDGERGKIQTVIASR